MRPITESTQDARDSAHAEALADLQPGAVVAYLGTLTEERCFEHIVLGYDPGHAGQRYVLGNREYPWFTMSRVRRSSIDPTGEQLALCAHCSHPHEHYYRDPNLCAVTICRCDQHAPPAVAS